MKTKQIEKKLELRKITIANLDKQEMNRIQAGGSPKCVSSNQSSCCAITDNN